MTVLSHCIVISENSVDLSGYGGVITTPMYPEYVHKQGALSWRITVQDGKVIQLTFTDFMFYHNEEGSCSSVLRVSSYSRLRSFL